MLKCLFFISLIILPYSGALSRVEWQWLTVAGMVLEDENTRIMIDPVFTRPNWKQWLALEKFKADKPLILKTLKDLKIDKADAIFITHSHFDHAVDATTIAGITGARLFAGNSFHRIVRAHRKEAIHYEKLQNTKPVTIGEFTITPIHRPHAKLVGPIGFLPGEVPEGFDFSLWDYHEGETWMFLVEHRRRKILIDVGEEDVSRSVSDIRPDVQKVDVLVQGVYNHKKKMLLKGNVERFKPRIFIPIHWDNFLLSFDPGNIQPLPLLEIDTAVAELRKSNGTMNVIKPEFGKKLVLFE